MTRVQQIAEDLLRYFEPDEARTYEGYVGYLNDWYYFQADISVNPVYDVKETRDIMEEESRSEYSHTLWYEENLKIYKEDDEFVGELSNEEHEKLIKYLQS